MEIYKNPSSQESKEFEKLLNSSLSKTQIEEGKIVIDAKAVALFKNSLFFIFFLK